MEQLKTTRMIWQCNKCEDIVVSYSHRRHEMNECECKISAVDLENEYCRILGYVKELSVKKLIDGRWIKED